MAYISYLRNEDWPEESQRIDANILRISGIHMTFLRTHLDFYVTIHKKKSPISRAQREMIALRVSVLNRCFYWAVHHGAALRMWLHRQGKTPEESACLCSAIEKDPSKAALSTQDRAILHYVEKLTLCPSAIIEDDIHKLRAQGFNDRGIHDICSCAAYFNYVNRLAEGLGIELEENLWNENDWYPGFKNNPSTR